MINDSPSYVIPKCSRAGRLLAAAEAASFLLLLSRIQERQPQAEDTPAGKVQEHLRFFTHAAPLRRATRSRVCAG